MTYEEEYKKLENWYWKQKDEINNIPDSGGLDGDRSERGAELNRELTKKLGLLQGKYKMK